jgi:FkbM family methyltransferase
MLESEILSECKKMAGRVSSQTFFEMLYKASLIGMNIGGGDSILESGEIGVLQYVKNKLINVTNPVLFDGGANIGNYTLTLNKEFGDGANIYAFEPSKATFAQLQETIGLRSNIHLQNIGLNDKNEEITLFTNQDGSGLASIYNRLLDHFGLYMDKKENIKVTTLDSFCLENNIEHIHFLKLDVEGNELRVLQGAKKMLQNIDFMQFEFGGCNIDSKVFFRDFFYLLKNQFLISRILIDGLYPIKQYKEQYENFSTTNYFVEKIY